MVLFQRIRDDDLCCDRPLYSEVQPFALRCAACPPALPAEAAACANAAAAAGLLLLTLRTPLRSAHAR